MAEREVFCLGKQTLEQPTASEAVCIQAFKSITSQRMFLEDIVIKYDHS